MAYLILLGSLLSICQAHQNSKNDEINSNNDVMDQQYIVETYDQCYTIVAIVVVIVMLIVIIDLWCCIDTENRVNEPYYLQLTQKQKEI